ncbi:MAG: segregation/condensation protein A [Clostridiales bacterium]|nr:segregation/condensation protein A [Clostridiales bacterium]
MSEEQKSEINIKLDVFEGPFDLLLTLLERNKLEITDIRISLIADQYLDVLKEHFNMEMASEFLVMASWLMHLKSKRLLPKQEKEEEEEITEEELARRLAQYKKYRDATPEITERYRYWSRAYYKMPEALEFPKKYALPEIDPDAFAECFAEVRMRWRLRRNDDREKMERILKVEKVSLRDKMKQVVKSVFHRARAKFSELFSFEKSSRTEIVTGFLALLELERRKRVRAEQTENFGEIEILPGEEISEKDLNGEFGDGPIFE